MNMAKPRSILDKFLYLAGGIADLMLPDSCAACGAGEVADHGLCLNCHLKLLSLVALPYCRRCGASLGPAVPERDDGCRACPVTLPRFLRVIRLGSYADPLRAVCRDLKYRHQETLRRRLGRLLAEAVSARLADRMPEVVLAVPMHWRRRLGRPCDHARLLAGVLADCLHLPLGYELVRLRNTPPQVHLSRTKRIENVRGAFGLARGAKLAGANVLLVDDVTTTGATANEAARTLLDGGVSSVTLAVVAKAEPPTAYAEHWRESR
jgi:ComF family protein